MGELVELDVTTVEESVTVNVTEEGQVDIAVFAETGPAGPAGPNSVTSATTSNATCVLTLEALSVGPNSTVTGSAAAAIGECSATASYAFAVGYQNTASGGASFASGTGSTSSGFASFTLGSSCLASGTSSIAIGVRAKAIHDGASVESDSQDADIESTTTDEKTFRFQNGYRFLGGAVTIDDTLNCDHIHGNIAGSVYAHVRAGENLAKGDPVYISGSHGTGASLIAIVSKADASNAAKMPAVGVMDAAVSNNANGHMVITGTISDIDTNAYAVNSVLYVASGGGWTSTPPAANSQPVAIVERSNTNNGAVIVKVNGLASSGGNGASDANKLVRYPSAGSTGSGAIVQATSPTLTSPTLTGTTINTSLTLNATTYNYGAGAKSALQQSIGVCQRTYMTSDFSLPNAGTDTAMDVSLDANSVYLIKIVYSVSGTSASSFGTINGANGLTISHQNLFFIRDSNSNSNIISTALYPSLASFGLFPAITNNRITATIEGVIYTVNAGVIRFSTGAPVAATLTRQKGSYYEITKLS